MKRLLVALLLAFFSAAVHAGEAMPLAKNPEIEKRMLDLSEGLRCLVCQNETLAASQAELALDLKQEIREMMQKGMSDQEITDYLVKRYGDFVRYNPPLKPSTYFLWFGPFVIFAVGISVLVITLKRRRTLVTEKPLTPEEQRRAQSLLEDKP